MLDSMMQSVVNFLGFELTIVVLLFVAVFGVVLSIFLIAIHHYEKQEKREAGDKALLVFLSDASRENPVPEPSEEAGAKQSVIQQA